MNILVKKYSKIAGLVLGSVFICLVVFSLVINFFFREQLISYVIGELNKQVDSHIDIKKADFAFWRSFPYVSVNFEGVYVQSSKTYQRIVLNNEKVDTLLIADKVIFEFNVIRLLQKKFVLKRIQVNDGSIYLKTDRVFSNYDIFISGDSTKQSSDLNINHLVFKNCQVEYRHKDSGLLIQTNAKKIEISGIISSHNTKLFILSDLFIKNVSKANSNYIQNRSFRSDIKLNIIDKVKYIFNGTQFSLSDLQFNFDGYISSIPTAFIDFTIRGRNLDLSGIFNEVPGEYRKYSDCYSASGEIDFRLSIKGDVGNSKTPRLNLKYAISDGEIIEKSSKIKLSKLQLEGMYGNGRNCNMQSSYIKVNKCISNIGSGEFSLNGTVANFIQPKIDVSVITQLELNDVKQFLQLDTFSIFDGKAESSFTISGTLPGFNNLMADAKNLDYSGQLNLHNASFQVTGSKYLVRDINGLIIFDNDISFNKLSLFLHDNKIKLSGKMINGIPYLLKLIPETEIEANLVSNRIDLSNYFIRGDTSKSGEYSREFLFPDNIRFDLNLNISEFKINRFEAKWVKGNLTYKPGMFVIKALSLETCEGKVTGNGAIMQDYSKSFIVKGQSDVSRINIQKMFYTFNNFTQKVIKSENLKGKISGRINFSSVWDHNLLFKPEFLIVDADVTIANGELVKFEPMYGLSKFIALDELKQIKFSTLHNNIYIKDKQIVIPQMEIQSSAFNIIGSGTHDFNNHYKYKVRILLSEILYKKAKNAKKENEEYGQIEDDGLGRTTIPLSIEGIGNKYKITYDSKSTLQVVKESLTKQKKELKEIFQEEFGWFKKDSVSGTTSSKSKAVKVQWDDEPATIDYSEEEDKKTETKKVKKPNDKVQVEWE